MTTPTGWRQELIAKLRYMGRQYAAGQFSRGGGTSKHYLEEAADELERLTAEKAQRTEAEVAAIMAAVDSYADGPHTEGYFGARRAEVERLVRLQK